MMWLGASTGLRAEDAPPAEAPPSAELLLYLAEFGDAQEEFVDPAEVDEALRHARAATPNATRDAAQHDAPPPIADEPEHDHDASPHR